MFAGAGGGWFVATTSGRPGHVITLPKGINVSAFCLLIFSGKASVAS